MRNLKDKILGAVFGFSLTLAAVALAVTGANGFLDLNGTPMLLATGGNSLTVGTSDETTPGDLSLMADGSVVARVDGSEQDLVALGDVDLETTGKTLVLEDGTPASSCAGTVVATGATAVREATTCYETGDYVNLTIEGASAPSAAVTCWYYGGTTATSFWTDCSLAGFTGTLNYVIVKGQ